MDTVVSSSGGERHSGCGRARNSQLGNATCRCFVSSAPTTESEDVGRYAVRVAGKDRKYQKTLQVRSPELSCEVPTLVQNDRFEQLDQEIGLKPENLKPAEGGAVAAELAKKLSHKVGIVHQGPSLDGHFKFSGNRHYFQTCSDQQVPSPD